MREVLYDVSGCELHAESLELFERRSNKGWPAARIENCVNPDLSVVNQIINGERETPGMAPMESVEKSVDACVNRQRIYVGK